MTINSKFKLSLMRVLLKVFVAASMAFTLGCGDTTPSTAEAILHNDSSSTSKKAPSLIVAEAVARDPDIHAKSTLVGCEHGPGERKLSSPLTIEVAEATSIKEQELDDPVDAEVPRIPKIPFGSVNAKWGALKSLIQPNDTLHRFEDDGSGGYVVMRGECIVGQIWEWMQ